LHEKKKKKEGRLPKALETWGGLIQVPVEDVKMMGSTKEVGSDGRSAHFKLLLKGNDEEVERKGGIRGPSAISCERISRKRVSAPQKRNLGGGGKKGCQIKRALTDCGTEKKEGGIDLLKTQRWHRTHTRCQ